MVGCCGGVAALVLLLISAGHAFGQSFLRFTSAPLTRVSPKHISYDGRWAAELIEDRIVVVHDVVNDTIVYRDESLGTRIQDVVMLGSTAVIVDSTGSAIALHQDGSHDTLFLEYSPSSWPMTSIRPYGAKALLFNRRVTVSGGRNLYHDYTTIVFDASLKQHDVYKTYGYTGESRSDIATFDGSSVISIFHQNIEGRASEDDPSLFFTITHPFADSLRLNVNHKESRFPEWRSCIVLSATKLFHNGKSIDLLSGDTMTLPWPSEYGQLCAVGSNEVVYRRRLTDSSEALGVFNVDTRMDTPFDTIVWRVPTSRFISAESRDEGNCIVLTCGGIHDLRLYRRKEPRSLNWSLRATVSMKNDVVGSMATLRVVPSESAVPRSTEWFIDGRWQQSDSPTLLTRVSLLGKQGLQCRVRLTTGDSVLLNVDSVECRPSLGVIRQEVFDRYVPFAKVLSLSTSDSATSIAGSNVRDGTYLYDILADDPPRRETYPRYAYTARVIAGSICPNNEPMFLILDAAYDDQLEVVDYLVGFSRVRPPSGPSMRKDGKCKVHWSYHGSPREERKCSHLRTYLSHGQQQGSKLIYSIASDILDGSPYDAVVRTWLMRIDRDTGLTNPYGHYAPGTLKNPGRMYRSIHVGSRDKGVVTHDSGFIVIDVASGAFIDSASVVGLKDAVIDRQGRIHTPQGVYQRDVQTWRHERTLPFSDGIGTLMIADTAVAVIRASQDSMIYVYDIRTNDVLAFRGRYPGQASSWAFAEGANVIVIGTDEGMVHCLRLDEIAGSNVPVDYGDDDDKPGYVYHDEETLEEYSVMRFTSPLRRVELYTTLGALLQRQDVDGVREFRLDAIRDIPSGPVFVVFRTDAGAITRRLFWVRQ